MVADIGSYNISRDVLSINDESESKFGSISKII